MKTITHGNTHEESAKGYTAIVGSALRDAALSYLCFVNGDPKQRSFSDSRGIFERVNRARDLAVSAGLKNEDMARAMIRGLYIGEGEDSSMFANAELVAVMVETFELGRYAAPFRADIYRRLQVELAKERKMGDPYAILGAGYTRKVMSQFSLRGGVGRANWKQPPAESEVLSAISANIGERLLCLYNKKIHVPPSWTFGEDQIFFAEACDLWGMGECAMRLNLHGARRGSD